MLNLYSRGKMTALLTFHETIPLSLYVHLPWCVRKCPYCDFNSHEIGQSKLTESEYIDALIRDLEQSLPLIWGRKVSSIFIGGGTPSLFSPAAIDQLINQLHARLNFYPDIEITLEANPGTVEAGKFKGFKEAGVNRLSIGVQSFSDQKLKLLGRIHGSSEAHAAIEQAQAAGFNSINIDLMYGLPQQTMEDAMQDLETAMACKPQHISWYQLTIEPNTVFYTSPPKLPDDDRIWDMQEQGQAILIQQGYHQYEISAFAQENYQCLHNLNYWQFGDYLGIGAGAHSKITNVTEATITRQVRHRIPKRYIELAQSETAVTENKQLDHNDIALEFMMNAMRLNAGVNPGLFLQRTGMPLSNIETELNNAEKKGLLEWELSSLKPTRNGSRYLNNLLQEFM